MAAEPVTSKQRLLVIAHGHPRWSIGGGENAAYALHRAFADRPGWTSLFLAAAPSGMDQTSPQSPLCWPLDTTNEWLIRRSEDWLMLRRSMQAPEVRWLKAWCIAMQPNVIHVHHLVGVGLDVLLAMRQWLPEAKIVFTLHEFLLLCPLRGQLLRRDGTLCHQASIEDCSQCLPEISPSQLWLRHQWMETLKPAVDHWIAPSATLRDQFSSRGFSTQHISILENILPVSYNKAGKKKSNQRAKQADFGYFGTLSYSKGVDIILEAFDLARRSKPNLRLDLHGPCAPNPDDCKDPEERAFHETISALLDQLGDSVTLRGPYNQDNVFKRMSKVHWVVMASRWLENSPVVIQEAQTCGAPLLVPALGGMAEKVEHGVHGLHYPAGDRHALADALIRCAEKGSAQGIPIDKRKQAARRNRLIREYENLYSSVA